MFITYRVFSFLIFLAFLCWGCKKDVPSSITGSSLSGVKIYGTPNGGVLRSFEATADGGYLFGGYTTTSADHGPQGFIQKCDKNGNVTWYQAYGNTGDDKFEVVRPTSDGGLIAAGYSSTNGYTKAGGVLVKTDANGTLEWQKTFSANLFGAYFYDVKETPDHGFVAVGFVYGNDTTVNPLYVVKTDNNGDSIWTRQFTIDKNHSSQGWSLAIGLNGEIAVASTSQDINTATDLYPVFTYLSPGGILIVPEKSYTVFGPMPYYRNEPIVNIEKIISRPDGFLYVFSSGRKVGNPNNPYCNTCGISQSVTLFKIDFSGNVLWSQVFDGLGNVVINDAINNPDGGLLISGGLVDSSGTNYCWLLNTDANGNKTSEYVTPLKGTTSWAAGAANNGKSYAIGINSQALVTNGVRLFGFLSIDLKGNIIDQSK